MNDGWTQPMREGDDPGQLVHHLERPRQQIVDVAIVPLADQAGEVAAGDVLVFQTWRIAFERRVEQCDDAGVFALADDPAEQVGLVAQEAGGRRVETELERDGGKVAVGRLPHLAEAADTEQLVEDPVAKARRVLALLEQRQSRREQGEDVGGTGDRQRGDDRSAGRVGGAPLRLADGGGDLGEIGNERQLKRFGVERGLGGNDFLRLAPRLLVGDLRQRLDLGSQLGLRPAPGPPLVHVVGHLRQRLGDEVAGDAEANIIQGGLGNESQESKSALHHGYLGAAGLLPFHNHVGKGPSTTSPPRGHKR